MGSNLLERKIWNFTMKSLLEGIPTTWCDNAIVYDEKALTFKQSWNQRKRWVQGHFDVGERYIPKLLKEGIKKRDIIILDGVIDLFQPYFLLLSTLFVIAVQSTPLCSILHDSALCHPAL